jgi:hypothetical protein
MTQLVNGMATLTCHSDTSMPAVAGISARTVWFAPATLAVTFILTGGIADLRVPVSATPRRADGLWRHTCFEVFARAQKSQAYFEFNFSPSGEWAAYTFQRYREGGLIDDDTLDPKIAVRRAANSLELDAVIRMDRLPGMTPSATLHLGFTAVIEDRDGRLSYWALRHPPGKPDFHHAGSFALKLSLPGQQA